jgi:electron transfer flavoprotein alpha subunit
MPGFLAVAETNPDGSLARIGAEIATLARTLAEAAGADATGVIVAADPAAAANELATYVPKVLAITEPATADHAWAQLAAERVAAAIAEREIGTILVGAGPDGRDLAGTLMALLGTGVLVNATAVTWGDGSAESGPIVEMSVFGGKLVTTSTFTEAAAGPRIVTVRPNVVTAAAASAAGSVENLAPSDALTLPAVKIIERIEEAGAAAPIEEARVIVAGGRGVGGGEGFKIVQELADALGGAVGATRAAVDSGWIPYAQQIGQTGKIVKPRLYFALGISGAIQHKVGMQTAETIIAINRDEDAPIAEFADMLVVGDLFEVGNAVLAELKARG